MAKHLFCVVSFRSPTSFNDQNQDYFGLTLPLVSFRRSKKPAWSGKAFLISVICAPEWENITVSPLAVLGSFSICRVRRR